MLAIDDIETQALLRTDLGVAAAQRAMAPCQQHVEAQLIRAAQQAAEPMRELFNA